MRSSITDHGDYRRFCRLVAQEEDLFKTFRLQPICRQIVETVTPDQGRAYLQSIRTHYPELLNSLASFQKNDQVGRVEPEQKDQISATTLRYIKTYGDLLYYFGDLSSKSIAEIGGGYGGLARILIDQAHVKNYTIIDLPEALELIEKYLFAFGIENINLIPFDQISKSEFDLVISNYAFSECDRRMQESYFNKIIEPAKEGYLICNSLGNRNNANPYDTQEIQELFNQWQRLPEAPTTGEDNWLYLKLNSKGG